jgi:hypothetical protein
LEVVELAGTQLDVNQVKGLEEFMGETEKRLKALEHELADVRAELEKAYKTDEKR